MVNNRTQISSIKVGRDNIWNHEKEINKDVKKVAQTGLAENPPKQLFGKNSNRWTKYRKCFCRDWIGARDEQLSICE